MKKTYNIAWVPFSSSLSNNKLFDISMGRDNALERFVEAKLLLEAYGGICNTIDLCSMNEIDIIIFYGFSSELRYLLKTIHFNPHVKLLNIPLEPPIVSPLHSKEILSCMPFDSVLTWNDQLTVQGKKFTKCNYGEPMIYLNKIPQIKFECKKFLVAITSSKLIQHKNGIHQERFNAFNFFSTKKEGLDLYGVGWEQTSYSFVKTCYKGLCETKKDVLQHYKFSICFENAKNYPGLITEKIFDCFAAGVVPIYYGPPNIHDYIPENSFINFPSFASYEELYEFLVAMTAEEHQAYLDAAKAFIASPAYEPFTSKRFAEIICEQVQTLINEPQQKRTMMGFKWHLFKIVLKNPLFFIKNLKQCRRFLFDLAFTF